MKLWRRLSRISRGAAVLTLWLSLLPRADAAQQATQASPEARRPNSQAAVDKLEIGRPIDRELKGGETHTYEIALEANQFLSLVVEQKGIDVVVKVIAADGSQLVEVDSPNGSQGPELVTLVAKASGNYKINIGSLEANAPSGRYEIRVTELRAATERDIDLAEAAKLSKESNLLSASGKYDDAITLCARALEIREKLLEPEHLDVAVSLNNLALLYQHKGEVAKAEPLYQRALDIFEKKLGPENADVATVLNNIANLSQNQGDYAKAERLHQREIAILEKVLGPEDSEVATSLNNLSVLYQEMGEYKKAEPLSQRSLAILVKKLGPEDSLVATSMSNLALLYDSSGDYAKAEEFYQRALSIREKALPPDHPDIANSLNNLGLLYQSKGDYDKAERLHRRALAIRERALGPENRYVGLSFLCLADLYHRKGDYAKAEPLYLRSLSIYEKALDPEHPDVGNVLSHLARLYEQMGDLAKAEPLHQRSRSILVKSLGLDHPKVVASDNSLALLFQKKGEYQKAEPLYQRALAAAEKSMGSEHPYVATTLDNIANLLTAEDDPASALAFRTRAVLVTERNIASNIVTGSERSKLAYLALASGETNAVISLNVLSLPQSREATRLALSVILSRKGRALDAMTDSISKLRRQASPDDQKLLDRLASVRSQLAAVTLRGPGREGIDRYKANVKALEDEVENIENQVSQRSQEFRTQVTPISLENIQKAIPANSALVEFSVYRPFNPKPPKKEDQLGEPRYVAYVLHDHGEPSRVELGAAKEIDAKVAAFRKALSNKRSLNVKRLARTVDVSVMQPVRRLLGRTRRVFLSPDGLLNLVPFASLVDEQHQYLVRRYSFTYLTSGRDLLRLQTKVQGKTATVVIADPDFGQIEAAASRAANGTELDEVYFRPLKGTEAEARELKRLFPDADVMTRRQATEAALKSADRPAILHIATHGFFLSDEQQLDSQTEGEKTRLVVRRKERPRVRSEDDPSQLVNPLMRSGLGLAGANERTHSEGDDGILTALEASGLDLWGTKLVVLSACDTGIGKVVSGDGVYGLRRALVLAGSESQLISLWPVSDVGTRELMIEYYKRLKAGEGRSEALRRVQLKMLASRNRKHPFYWASFIQSGEWASLDGRRPD